jgi:hypothetical protein
MTEGVAKSPDYVSFCAMFPQLRAIRHTTSYDYYIVDHVPNEPFRFHSLDSLDIHLPSALVEDVPGDIPVEPVSVTSLTLRSHEEFMLHLPGPFTDSEPDWLHNVVRQVKDVQQLNLHTGLEDDTDRLSPYYSNLPTYDPFPGFRKEDFPDLQELNIYFTTRYRNDDENPCDLVSCPWYPSFTRHRCDTFPLAATLHPLPNPFRADDPPYPLLRPVSRPRRHHRVHPRTPSRHSTSRPKSTRVDQPVFPDAGANRYIPQQDRGSDTRPPNIRHEVRRRARESAAAHPLLGIDTT